MAEKSPQFLWNVLETILDQKNTKSRPYMGPSRNPKGGEPPCNCRELVIGNPFKTFFIYCNNWIKKNSRKEMHHNFSGMNVWI